MIIEAEAFTVGVSYSFTSVATYWKRIEKTIIYIKFYLRLT